mgnify:CR=1 FL=1
MLSLRQYTKLIEQPCYYCGTSMANSMGTGLDRLDNRYGYSKKNVVTCCGICNRTRGIYYTPEETKVMIDALLLFRAKRNRTPATKKKTH